MRLRLDHLVFAVQDLAAATGAWKSTFGLQAEPPIRPEGSHLEIAVLPERGVAGSSPESALWLAWRRTEVDDRHGNPNRKPDQGLRPQWRRRLSSLVRRVGAGRARQASGAAVLLEEFASELVPFDGLLARAGLLRPTVAFGVYKKRQQGEERGSPC